MIHVSGFIQSERIQVTGAGFVTRVCNFCELLDFFGFLLRKMQAMRSPHAPTPPLRRTRAPGCSFLNALARDFDPRSRRQLDGSPAWKREFPKMCLRKDCSSRCLIKPPQKSTPSLSFAFVDMTFNWSPSSLAPFSSNPRSASEQLLPHSSSPFPCLSFPPMLGSCFPTRLPPSALLNLSSLLLSLPLSLSA